MANILITGGTGLIGTALAESLLAKGHTVAILTRSKKTSAKKRLSYIPWNLDDETISADAIEMADFIVHLAGASVAEGRWTSKRKAVLISSRVKSGELIARSLQRIPNHVRAVISASGIGWYGSSEETQHGEKGFVETDSAGNDFLAQVCMQWENAVQPVVTTGTRLVIFRFGLVLSSKGGAYAAFRKPYHFRMSPVLGDGKQVISWIHIEDCVRMIQFAMDKNLSGVYNGVSPEPVTNLQLNQYIREAGSKWYLPIKVPGFILRMALGEMSVEVLKSAKVSSEKIERAGFTFLYRTPAQAIHSLENR